MYSRGKERYEKRQSKKMRERQLSTNNKTTNTQMSSKRQKRIKTASQGIKINFNRTSVDSVSVQQGVITVVWVSVSLLVGYYNVFTITKQLDYFYLHFYLRCDYGLWRIGTCCCVLELPYKVLYGYFLDVFVIAVKR